MDGDDYTWPGEPIPVSPWQLRIDEDLATVDTRTCDEKYADLALTVAQFKDVLEYISLRLERLERASV
jgi:hypothetical protein